MFYGFSLPHGFLLMTHSDSFHFQPCSHSWVAIHPQPVGVVQFMGGAFFGTYPTLFYRQLLRQFYEAGYTVVALPFRFTLDHWGIALTLLQEHYALRPFIIEAAQQQGYSTDVYLDAANYCWLGHSLGCKYIALLELLSNPQEIFTAYSEGIGIEARQWTGISRSRLALTHTLRQIEADIHKLTGQSINYAQPSIWNEASLLLAPTITDLNGAVPIKLLEQPLSRVLKVAPTVEQTHTLIRRSKLFNLTHIIQFSEDAIAQLTCNRLIQQQPRITHSLLSGNHLSPLGWKLGCELGWKRSETATSHQGRQKAVSALIGLQRQLKLQTKSQLDSSELVAVNR